MKKITFPHMGNLYIPAQTFFKELGYEVVVPPKNSRRTLDLGMKYSPEFACLPLKINIGNFIQAIERGAEIIVMGGGVGPCRFGYYCEVQKEILKDLGYRFQMISLEPEIFKTFNNIRQVMDKIPWLKIFSAAKLAWSKIVAMDKIHKQVLKSRSCEKKDGIVDTIYAKFLKELEDAWSIIEIKKLEKEYSGRIKETKGIYKRGVEIKIGIVGEIYVVLEPFTNLNIERKLGELGVTVDKEIYISHWVRQFLNMDKNHEKIQKAALPYLRGTVGGHGLDSVGNSVLYASKGFDGVVQVAPFTCMPEIVAQSILPEVSNRENIAILSLIFDEHTGEAGLITRLEAFVDLLVRKKKYKGAVNSG